MKKNLLLTIALLFSVTVFSQSRATFVNETFDGSGLPEGWTTSEVGNGNWRISSTTYSNGEGKELKLTDSPYFEGTTRLITTPFDLSGVDEITISFKHFFDNFKDNEFVHKIGVATSTDGITWNEGWSQEYTTTGLYNVKETFITADMGKSNVMFCIFYEGVSKNMDGWFFDDLLIFKQTDLDLRLIDINIPNIIETGDREIAFTVQNMGLNTIKSVEAKIKVSNWESDVVATFEQEIKNSEIIQLTYKDKLFNALAKNKPYSISIEIISINGEEDQDSSNNYLKKNVSVAFNQAQRVPMIEHFSSSTCGPCVAVNQQMHPLMLANEGKFTYTKFPTAGDPYHNFEAAHRVSEYGVTGVPNIFLDGMSKGSNYLTQNMLDERYNTPAYADIRGAFTLDGDQIKIIADFMSYVELDNVKAYITINETTTVKNTGSNGEKEFHHILMKMLKSKSGNDMNLKAGEYQRLEFTHNMSLTNVEELDDLEVALWLQNPVTQEIYNSHFAYAYAEHCYPIQNLTLEQNDDEKTLTWESPEKGTPVYYKVYINGKIVSENETATSYTFNSTEENFTAEIIAVYENEKTSVGVAKLFGEVEEYITLESPKNLTATPTSTSAISLKWDAVENATSYNIYQGNEIIAKVESQETSYSVENLNYNTEYCFEVTAVADDIESEHSGQACAKTLGESLEEISSSLLLYPNPAENELIIATELHVEEIAIYDIYGRTVSQQVNMTTRQQVVDVADLEAGIYFVNIKTDNGNIVRRFVKN